MAYMWDKLAYLFCLFCNNTTISTWSCFRYIYSYLSDSKVIRLRVRVDGNFVISQFISTLSRILLFFFSIGSLYSSCMVTTFRCDSLSRSSTPVKHWESIAVIILVLRQICFLLKLFGSFQPTSITFFWSRFISYTDCWYRVFQTQRFYFCDV